MHRSDIYDRGKSAIVFLGGQWSFEVKRGQIVEIV